MSRRQYQVTFVKFQPTLTTQTLCGTPHNLLNMSIASHTDDRLHLIELQLMRLMHRKNVCTPVTPIRKTEEDRDANRCFQSSYLRLYIYCCDEDLSVWMARNVIHQQLFLQLHF